MNIRQKELTEVSSSFAEKDRVLQMCELDRETNQLVDNLEEQCMELKRKEMQMEKEKQDLRREWDLLRKCQAELAQEKKKVCEMRHELEQNQRKMDKMEDVNSFFTEREEQRMTEQWKGLNNNSYFMPVNANMNMK